MMFALWLLGSFKVFVSEYHSAVSDVHIYFRKPGLFRTVVFNLFISVIIWHLTQGPPHAEIDPLRPPSFLFPPQFLAVLMWYHRRDGRQMLIKNTILQK